MADDNLRKNGQSVPLSGMPGQIRQGGFMQRPPTFPTDINYADEYEEALYRKPKTNAILLTFTVALLFVVMIAWAWFAELDEVVHADGQIMGSQRTQIVQNLEGGILRKLNVREGQTVNKGEVLAELENDEAESLFKDNVNKYAEDSLALLRLEAEARKEEPEWPVELRSFLEERLAHPVDETVIRRATQLLEDQKVLHATRLEAIGKELDILKSQNEQRALELNELRERQKQLSSTLHYTIQQRDTARSLYHQQNYSKLQYLDLEQKVADLSGQINVLKASIPRTEAAIDETKKRIVAREADYMREITEEIGKRRIELASLAEMINTGKGKVSRTEIRSPVYGSVRQIYNHTIGGVVKPGEPIMDIVPLENTLLVEARVQPQDVAFIRPKQKTMVKVTAYDFAKYGGLDGHIEHISADTVDDPHGNKFYKVQVRTDKNHLTFQGENLEIIPGMMVMVDIMTGKKTVLDYIMKPIFKARQNAMRER